MRGLVISGSHPSVTIKIIPTTNYTNEVDFRFFSLRTVAKIITDYSINRRKQELENMKKNPRGSLPTPPAVGRGISRSPQTY